MILKRDETGPFTGELILPTVADDLFLQDGGHGLKLESLQTSEGSADSQIKLNPSGNCICLELIEFNRLSGRLKNMANKQKDRVSDLLVVSSLTVTHALSVLLNLARFTSIRALPAFA
jgi:hypothetical protein